MKKPILKLTGVNGNAYALLGKARRVARKNDMDFEAIRKDAMSGDYGHLLQTLTTHFNVC